MYFFTWISSFLILNGWTFLKCLVTLYIGWFIYTYIKNWFYKFPPGPIGFPFLGSVPYLDKTPERIFLKWTKKYGPIISLDIGSHRSVVLNTYEAIEEAYIQQNTAFTGRYKTYFTETTTKNKGIILLSEENGWKAQRRFGSRALTGLSLQGRSIEERILEEAEHLCDSIRQMNGEPFILEKKLIISIANVIGGIMLKTHCHENKTLSTLAETVVESFRKNGFFYMLLNALPWTRFIPFFRNQFKTMLSDISSGDDVMSEIIKEHLERFDPKDVGDLIDVYLSERQKKTPSFEELEQLRYYLKDLFVAGTETTTSTIRWILFYLIKNPEIQEKVHKEIDEVVGPSGKVGLNLDLPFTKAVIQEGYRIRTATPLSVPRSTTKNVKLMGYHIPKNTQIFANLWAVHNNPDDWNHPDQFIPERHLDKDGNFIKSNKIIPFSIGSRNCLGETLARAEVFLFVVKILQKFRVLPNPDNPTPPLEGIPGIVYTPQHYPMIMKEK